MGGKMKPGEIQLDYGRAPRFMRLRKWLYRVIWATATCTLLVGLIFGWLWWGWYSEQGAIKQIEAEKGFVEVWPLQIPIVTRFMPYRWRWSLERGYRVGYWPYKAGDVDLKGVDRLTGLRDIMLTSRNVTDTSLVQLRGLKELRILHLGETKISDSSLVNLKGLTELRTLDLRGTQVTNSGLVNLTGLTKLQELDLSYTKVTDVGLVQLKGLRDLQELNLFRAGEITDAGVAELKKALPGCAIQR